MKKYVLLLLSVLLAMGLLACNADNDDLEGPHEHNYVCRSNIPSTCKEQGGKVYVCKCGDQYTEPYPPVEHTYDEWETVIKPTMTTVGKASQICSVCNSKEDKELTILTVEEYIAAYIDELIDMPVFNTTEELTAEAAFNWILLNVETISSKFDDKNFTITNVYSVAEISRMSKHYLGKTFDFEAIYLLNDSFTYREYDDTLTWVNSAPAIWPKCTMETITKIDDTHYTLRYVATETGGTQPSYYGTLTLELSEDRFIIRSHVKE